MFTSQDEMKCIGQIVLLPCNRIITHRLHPRKKIDGGELLKLSASIKKNGMIIPIGVRPVKYGHFELIYGERRLRAAKLAGITKVPAIITDVSKDRAVLYSLAENKFGIHLGFFEEAESINRLMIAEDVPQDKIAEFLCVTPQYIEDKLNLLNIPRTMRIKMICAGLTENHCKEILKLNDKSKSEKALNEIISNKLNVYQTSELVKKINSKTDSHENKILFKDIKIFKNTIDHAVEMMKSSGIDAKSEKTENDEFIEYSIFIPKKTSVDIRSRK